MASRAQNRDPRRRPPGESRADPGYPLPDPTPQLREDFSPAGRKMVTDAVSDAGVKAFGAPIRMADATRTRRRAVERAIDAAPDGVPEGLEWYRQHQKDYEQIAARQGGRLGRAIDTGAVLSTRNSPENEKLAAESALHIANNPDRVVEISKDMAPKVGEFRKTKGEEFEEHGQGRLIVTESVDPGQYRLGDLSNREVASLGYAANQAGEDIDPLIGDLPSRAAGRPVAAKSMIVARGGTFSDASKAPKTTSYATSTHQATDAEDRYNRSVFARRRAAEEQPGQGALFSAAEETAFDPSTANTATAEDMYQNAMSAEVAARKGGTGKHVRVAMEQLGHAIQKGRGRFDPSLTKDEMLHAFNNEATRRTAEQIGYEGWTPSGDVKESITPNAAQAVAWTQYRRELGDDPEWNAANQAQAALESADQRDAAAQGFMDFDKPKPKPKQGKKVNYTKAERAARGLDEESDAFVARSEERGERARARLAEARANWDRPRP